MEREKVMEKNNKFSQILVVLLVAVLVYVCTSSYYTVKYALEENMRVDYEYDMSTFEKLQKVKQIVDSSYLYEYEEDELIDGAINGMLLGLDDPYAAYYNADEFEEFYVETEGKYVGVGLYITYDNEKLMGYVISPIENSPAADEGVLPGDYIYSVDGVLTSTMDLDSLGSNLKGEEGTTVEVVFVRYDDGESEKIIKTLTRRTVIVNPVVEKIYENDIGYIKLSSFDENSYTDFKKVYDDLIKNEKVKGLILDLRNNPGGLLNVACNIADLLVPEGKIVYTVDKAGNEEALYSKAGKIEIPLVVLINEGSASASEILAGAIKDYGVGKIVGVTTYGKGVVQTLKSLKDGTYMKLTTAEYFSPNGNKINEIGISPDIEVELPDDIESYYNLSLEEDTQLRTAIEELKKMI